MNIFRGLRAAVRPAPNPNQEYEDFLKAGNPPWKPGYQHHKQLKIIEAINDPNYDPQALAKGHGWRLDERVIEYPWFIHGLPQGPGRLLDAGSVLNFHYLIGHPKVVEKKTFISTLAPDGAAFWQNGVSYVYEDLRDSCFRDDYFDWICCLSTLEHVGLDNTMLYTGDSSKKEQDTLAYASFLAELRRVLKPGGTLFVSVPFGRHVNHGWFQVFDSPRADSLIEAFKPASVKETVYCYRPEGWVKGTREEGADALYFDIHTQKEYDPDFAAASRAIICLEMTK